MTDLRAKNAFEPYMYSRLPLNGHLVKTDTSLKWTHGVGPCHTSVIYFISLQGRHLSKADSWSLSRACLLYKELIVCQRN